MKRIGFLYEKIYDKDNIRMAILNASKEKQHCEEVKIVLENIGHYVDKLHKILKYRLYKTSDYIMFIKNDNGKEREIFKLPFFPDRIAHWAIIQIVEPYFLDKLNHCTHSAIPGRGIHSAFKQLDEYMRSDPEGTKYCFKMDVKKFYPSIPHEKLKEMYRTIFKDSKLLELIYEIIDSTKGLVGIPIGNYLSQYSGNLYLYRFDRWLKEVLGVKYYIRYMDDVVILSEDKKYLHTLRELIHHELESDLGLTIKEDWQVFPGRVRGIDFVGYRHFGDYVLLRRSIALKLKRTMMRIRKKIETGGRMNEKEWSSINSYKGWLKWCNCHNLYTKYIKPLEPYAEEYYIREVKT